LSTTKSANAHVTRAPAGAATTIDLGTSTITSTGANPVNADGLGVTPGTPTAMG
jgi:hypothetical protein